MIYVKYSVYVFFSIFKPLMLLFLCKSLMNEISNMKMMICIRYIVKVSEIVLEVLRLSDQIAIKSNTDTISYVHTICAFTVLSFRD